MISISQRRYRQCLLAAGRLALGGALLLGLCMALLLRPSGSVHAAAQVLYSPNLGQNPNEDASYPRVIRLTHSGSANGTLLATFSHSNYNNQPASFPIYQSTDGGQTWSSSPISVVTDTAHPTWGLNGPTIFELPQAEGSYAAGTLLVSGSALPDFTQQSIDVFVSTDHGYTWSYLSSCASESGQPNTAGHGIWEPDFQIDKAGNLVCYFSDERQSGNQYNQLLGHVVSTNGGQTWGSEVYDVAVQDGVQRPGMPTVIPLPNGQYMMSFEDCKGGYDPDQACSVYVKTSPDGDNWSPVNGLGTLVQTSDGRHLLHTPYLTWSPAGGTNGELLLSGQRVVTGNDGALTVLPESGSVIFANTNLGSGSWSELPSPFTINPTGGYDSGETACPAYSSPILPSTDGSTYLYLAGVGISNGHCQVNYGTARTGLMSMYAPPGSDTSLDVWSTYGGSWSASNGIYSDSTSGPGDKSLSGSATWTDYTLQGDVRLNAAGQAGLIVRATNPGVGADAFNGYYLGLESTSGTFFLGREHGSWTGLTSTAMPGGVAANTWYHVTLQAIGCTLTASTQPVGSTTAPTSFTYTDTGCSFTAGQVGVRDHYTTASWRNVALTFSGTTSTAVAPYYAPFASGSSSGWTTYGGSWNVSSAAESYNDPSGGSGDKAVAGSTSLTNAILHGDVELTSAGTNANAGLLVRVTNPSVGVDALNGYFIGITASGSLILGRENSGWTYLSGVTIPGGVALNTWYHLIVQVSGCALTISVQVANTPNQTVLSYTDSGCTLTMGQFGVRTFNAGASWRFIEMTPLP